MPLEFFLGNFYLAFNDHDRLGNKLLGIRRVRRSDQKLNIVADLEPRKTFLTADTVSGKVVFRPVFDRRDRSAETLAVQFGNEAMFERLAIGGSARSVRPRVSRRTSIGSGRAVMCGRFTGLYAPSPWLVGLRVQFVLDLLPLSQLLERRIGDRIVKEHVGTAGGWFDETKAFIRNQ